MPRIHVGLHAVLGEEPEDRADREVMREELGGFFEMSPGQVDMVTVTGTPEEAAQRCAEYADAGADHIGFALDGRDYERQLRLLGSVRNML
ncbi:hypothetical protein [Nocardia sp. NPDC127526]|uniref:hypothetical protein n=1 Tax=Nocardia sp. NPDC127526 TaxID=3345393 RepID=UPI00362BBA7F